MQDSASDSLLETKKGIVKVCAVGVHMCRATYNHPRKFERHGIGSEVRILLSLQHQIQNCQSVVLIVFVPCAIILAEEWKFAFCYGAHVSQTCVWLYEGW